MVQSSLRIFARRLSELALLSADDQSALLALQGEIEQVQSNRDIVGPDEELHDAYLIVHGLVARFTQLRDGARQLTALYVPGDIADIHAVPVPRSTTALQALSTSTVIRIPLHAIRNLVHERPKIAEALWAYASIDAAILARWTASIARQPAKGRIAHLLCEVGIRLENAGAGDRRDFELNMTQTQLGEALGLTPVHVNRTLQSLRQGRLLVTSGRRVHINDWEALASMADFDPVYLAMTSAELRAA